MSDHSNAVLLLAHGSPPSASEADIRRFLSNVTGGRAVSEETLREVQSRYAQIGRSPLTDITRKQAEALEKMIGRRVYLGMRNWEPTIADVVAQMERDGVERATVLCLAPQNSRTSVGLYRRAVMEEPFQVDFIDSWHDHPGLIAAFAEKLKAAAQRVAAEADFKVPVLFTAHSVPLRTIVAGDPYEEQCHETAELVARACGLTDADWVFAFQSQGMSGGPWIGPTVEETILALAAQGVKGVLLQPI